MPNIMMEMADSITRHQLHEYSSPIKGMSTIISSLILELIICKMPISVVEIIFYIVEGTVLAKVVVNWSFWLGFSDLIMARLIAGNLLV